MDLLAGQAVRAVAGDRSNYRPIRSPLAGSADPMGVMRALLGLARFKSFYIADLDAITHAGSDRHFDLLTTLCAELGNRGVDELWLDAGAAPWLSELAGAVRSLRLVPVLGSESLVDNGALAARMVSLAGLDCVLSLDYRAGEFIGPDDLEQQPAQWPRRVVVMDLAAVGSGGGPAMARLDAVATMARAGGRTDVSLFAAGGVRDITDLRNLAEHGVDGVLLASALHDGAIDAARLRAFVATGQKNADPEVGV
jgi:phosphoribosylformimino-5-aminoimidazole carboxamide ribotide isomerase